MASSGNILSGKIYTDGAPSPSFSLRCYFIAPEAPLKDREGQLVIRFEKGAELNTPFPVSMETTPSFMTVGELLASGDSQTVGKGFHMKLSDFAVETNSIFFDLDGALIYNKSSFPEDKTPQNKEDESVPRQTPVCTVTIADETPYEANLLITPFNSTLVNCGSKAELTLPAGDATFPTTSPVSIKCQNVTVANTVKFYEPMMTLSNRDATYNTYATVKYENAALATVLSLTTLSIVAISTLAALF